MIAEIGQFVLVLTLVLACCHIVFCWRAVGSVSSSAAPLPWAQNAMRLSHVLALLLAVAFVLLIVSFLRSDFSVALVAAHSHSTKPWFYKIAASWGNHEGSLLLWVLLLAVYGSAFAFFERRLEPRTKLYTLMVQAVLLVLFLSFLIFTSNPFARLEAVLFQGAGLNPILQDIALVMHPPILYLGYVGFSIIFSLSLGGLLAARIDKNWVAAMRVPALLSWTALTCGVGLGSWWAYRELGWGGFWFWDPVENASLMPWLVGTALLHSLMVARKGQGLNWLVLLGIFAFLFSILGTFLTRSGLITSVHSFASDPTRGAFMLAILVGLAAAAIVLYSRHEKEEMPAVETFSREALLLGNNLFLISATLAVLVGTIYPLVLESFGGERISVGPPYFHVSFVPMMVIPVMVMPLAFLLSAQLKAYRVWFLPALLLSLLGGLLWQPVSSLASFGFILSLWLLLGTLTSAVILRKRARLSLGGLLAHAGLGLLLLGAVGTTAAQQEHIVAFADKEKIRFAHVEIQLLALRDKQGKDYRADEAELLVSQAGLEVARLYPQVRHYIARSQTTREAAIYTSWLPPADLHAILGDEVDGKRTIQFYYNPLAPLLWLGILVMALGGVAAVLPKGGRRK